VRTQTNLVRRGAVYYFRARVPADLVAHYGKRELFASLKTKDKPEALSKARAERVRLDQELAHTRTLLSTGCAPERSITTTCSTPALRPAVTTTVQTPKSHATKRVTSSVNPDDTLKALFNYWKTQGQKRPRTIQEAETVTHRLSKQVLDKAASKITKSEIVSFKDALLANGKAYATAAKQLNLLKAIFQTAVDNDKIGSNPASGVKVPQQKNKIKSRVPFSTSDLQTIFNSPIYTQGYRPKAGAGEAAYWIPLLALWSGARLEELGQLLVADIQEEAGIHYIHITNDGGDKHIKTASSRRKVPVHPELVSYGFMEYVASIKLAGHARLFPLIGSAVDRQKTASFSKWFGRYLRGELQINDSRKVFHSFRHGFKDACRNSGISSEHHDRFTGHVSGSIGDSYGAEFYPLKPLNEAMKLLRYEGLKLTIDNVQGKGRASSASNLTGVLGEKVD